MRLIQNDDGGNAIEMAITLMVVVILTLGTTDLALALWQWSTTEKATLAGARVAAVSDVVTPTLASYAGPSGVDFGTDCWDAATSTDICAAAVSNPVWCDHDSCSDGSAPSAAAFNAIVAAMQDINPLIEADKVQVEYTLNGLGFVGRPGGLPMDVTVRVSGMTFDLIALDALVGMADELPMPPFAATLVGEDYNSSF